MLLLGSQGEVGVRGEWGEGGRGYWEPCKPGSTVATSTTPLLGKRRLGGGANVSLFDFPVLYNLATSSVIMFSSQLATAVRFCILTGLHLMDVNSSPFGFSYPPLD